jgi:hypothetical protein
VWTRLDARRPFAAGIGVDVARRSVEVANGRVGRWPITLAAHAREMRRAMKLGGVYHATYSDCRGNPSPPSMREQIDWHAAVPMPGQTLDAIAWPSGRRAPRSSFGGCRP